MSRIGAQRRRILLAGLGGLAVSLPLVGRVLADDDFDFDPATAGVPELPSGGLEPAFTPAEPLAVRTGFAPAMLSIPSLGLDAPIVAVGQDEDGSMAAPKDPDTVAWYSLGPGMGIVGNVVFAGHVDWAGRPRTFGGLSRLDAGDAVLVVDEAGHGYQYVVESSHWVRAEGAPVEEIFSQAADHAVITLITCGGEYRAATREYLDRLIVRARGG